MIVYDDGIEGQFFVKLRNGVSVVDHAAELAAKYQGEVFYTYEPIFNGLSMRGLHETNAKKLSADPLVERVEQDRSSSPPRRSMARQGFFSRLSFLARNFVTLRSAQGVQNNWALDRIDQECLPLNGEFVRPNTGAGVHVYVIDSGVNDVDRELFGDRLSTGISFVGAEDETSDCADHGTSVAAIIGSNDLGVAPEVLIHPVRVWCGSLEEATIAAGVCWVVKHAETPAVANISLAFPFSVSLNEVVASAANRIAIVVAAGNGEGERPVDVGTVSPASVDDVVTVAGSTLSSAHDVRWPDSNYGPGVDLFAPSEYVYTYSAGGFPNYFVGTSLASGLVCGAAAIYLHDHPRATPSQVRAAIINAATQGKVSDRNGEPDRLLNINFPVLPRSEEEAFRLRNELMRRNTGER